MEYSSAYPSSVPHTTLVPSTFSLDKTFYVCSTIALCIVSLIACAFLIMSIYFRLGSHALLIDYSSKKNKKEAENIICQVLENTNYLDKMDNSDSASSSSNSFKENRESRNLQQDLKAQQLRICERRFVYYCIFFLPWVISVSIFTTSFMEVITMAALLAIVVGMNILRLIPNWKISLLLYILPSVAGFASLLGGFGSLYEWTPIIA